MANPIQSLGNVLDLASVSFPSRSPSAAGAAPTEAPTEAPVAPPAPAKPDTDRPPSEAPVDPGFRPDPGEQPAPHCPDSTCTPP
jgi:hypothetical protein